MREAAVDDAFRDLHRRVLLEGRPSRSVLADWYKDVERKHGQKTADFALRQWTVVSTIACTTHQSVQQVIQQQVNFVNENGDFLIGSQKGENIIGGAAGFGSKVSIEGDLIAFSENVKSTNMPPAIKEALVESRRAVEASTLIDAVKKHLVSTICDLGSELAKEAKPAVEAVQGLWQLLSSYVPTIPQLAGLGTAIATTYGIPLLGVVI